MYCETLVLATLMHPCYRMNIFDLAFGKESKEVTKCRELLKKIFLQYTAELASQPLLNVDPSEISIINKPPSTTPQSLMDCLESSNNQKPTPQQNEIKTFLKARLSFKKGAINDKNLALNWWKENSTTYPTLLRMACAYLGCSGSSCAVERLFLAALDVCCSSQGGLLPSTMSCCVSSLMWLREGVALTDNFAEAGKALNGLLPSKKKQIMSSKVPFSCACHVVTTSP